MQGEGLPREGQAVNDVGVADAHGERGAREAGDVGQGVNNNERPEASASQIDRAEKQAHKCGGEHLDKDGKRIHAEEEIGYVSKAEDSSAGDGGEPDAFNRICVLFRNNVLNDASVNAFLSDGDSDNAKHTVNNQVPRIPFQIGNLESERHKAAQCKQLKHNKRQGTEQSAREVAPLECARKAEQEHECDGNDDQDRLDQIFYRQRLRQLRKQSTEDENYRIKQDKDD